MTMRDLIPWNGRRSGAPSVYREPMSPFLSLHREMNRLFDETFRSFDTLAPFGGMTAWPSIEVTETDKELKVSAELPGLDEKDVELFLSEGTLTIRGEKKAEVDDQERHFSERFYGSFERRIPVDWEVEPNKVKAAFRNGVLDVTIPKSAKAQQKSRRIPINGS